MQSRLAFHGTHRDSVVHGMPSSVTCFRIVKLREPKCTVSLTMKGITSANMLQWKQVYKLLLKKFMAIQIFKI